MHILKFPSPFREKRATISCRPHSYPLFYEPLGLDKGHKFLEVGLGSGYGAAIAREIGGANGLVVSIDIDPSTFEFAVLVIPACPLTTGLPLRPHALRYLPPLIEQLRIGGRLIAHIAKKGIQELVLLKKNQKGVQRTVICGVLYLPLRGIYGADRA
jgi:protein-L-isoaspartate O-methyltransferase